MKKFSVRFFLLLGALLLSGYSQWYAHAYQSYVRPSSTQLSESTEQASPVTEKKSLALAYTAASSDREKEFIKIGDVSELREEEDEDNFSSFKKHLGNSKYTSSSLFAQTCGDFFSYDKKVSPFYKLFSYTSSDQYLILRVFRI